MHASRQKSCACTILCHSGFCIHALVSISFFMMLAERKQSWEVDSDARKQTKVLCVHDSLPLRVVHMRTCMAE